MGALGPGLGAGDEGPAVKPGQVFKAYPVREPEQDALPPRHNVAQLSPPVRKRVSIHRMALDSGLVLLDGPNPHERVPVLDIEGVLYG